MSKKSDVSKEQPQPGGYTGSYGMNYGEPNEETAFMYQLFAQKTISAKVAEITPPKGTRLSAELLLPEILTELKLKFPAASGKKDDKNKNFKRKFEANLLKAVQSIGNRKVGFGDTFQDDNANFDQNNWQPTGEGYTPYQHDPHMALIPNNVKPSVAIKAMEANPSRWKVDCAMFVQLLLEIALLDTIGAEKFDKIKNPNEPGFTLRQFDSTGINSGTIYQAIAGRLEHKEGSETISVDISTDALLDAELAKFPIGTNIAFGNSGPVDKSAATENCVKLGPDLYYCHPYGAYSRSQLYNFFAGEAPGIDSPKKIRDYIKDNIFFKTAVINQF